MGVGCQRHAPAALPLRKTRDPLYREVGWVLVPVWTGAENLPPPGFDPRNVQPIASRYIDCVIPAHEVRHKHF